MSVSPSDVAIPPEAHIGRGRAPGAMDGTRTELIKARNTFESLLKRAARRRHRRFLAAMIARIDRRLESLDAAGESGS